ncbi:hypothetical protein BJX96DRAFT_171778 [Aspergillus floccosus]
MDFHAAREQRDALAEALSCTTCIITDLTRATYVKHLRTGLYNPFHDPPFTISNNPESLTPSSSPSPLDDDVSPDTIASTGTSIGTAPHIPPSYSSLMTPSQLTRYHAQVTIYQSHDSARDVHFARYRVDYHIHLHYLRQRGMLTLCRNADDLHEFRDWKWRVFLAADNPAEPRRPRRWGWPGDAGLFMLYQMPLWRRGWSARRECVEQARVKWALIVEEYGQRR